MLRYVLVLYVSIGFGMFRCVSAHSNTFLYLSVFSFYGPVRFGACQIRFGTFGYLLIRSNILGTFLHVSVRRSEILFGLDAEIYDFGMFRYGDM